MNDLISRQAAIDAFGLSEKTRKYGGDHSGYDTRMLYEIQDVLEGLPSAETEPTERTYKRGYADGYHKAEKDYFERTEKDRKDAFKAGLEIGGWQRETGRWETTSDLERE